MCYIVGSVAQRAAVTPRWMIQPSNSSIATTKDDASLHKDSDPAQGQGPIKTAGRLLDHSNSELFAQRLGQRSSNAHLISHVEPQSSVSSNIIKPSTGPALLRPPSTTPSLPTLYPEHNGSTPLESDTSSVTNISRALDCEDFSIATQDATDTNQDPTSPAEANSIGVLSDQLEDGFDNSPQRRMSGSFGVRAGSPHTEEGFQHWGQKLHETRHTPGFRTSPTSQRKRARLNASRRFPPPSAPPPKRGSVSPTRTVCGDELDLESE